MGCDYELPYMDFNLFPPVDKHIERLSIAFDIRAVDMHEEILRLTNTKEDWERRNPLYNSPDDWRSHTHESLEWEILYFRWHGLLSQVHQLVLKRLEVNFQNCTCPCGCHRQVGWAASWVCEWGKGAPEQLVVVGTHSEEEREEIRGHVDAHRDAGNPKWPELSFERSMDDEGLMR